MGETHHVPTIDELIELPRPGDAQLSPAGDRVAYTVVKPDWEANEYVSQLWLVDNTAAETPPTPRQLTFAKTSSYAPRWSPDGQWLAFVSKRKGDDQPQLYRLSLVGGEAERLTDLPGGPSDITWSPDGGQIAFLVTDPDSRADQDRKEKYGDYQVEDVDYRYAHLWLLDLETRKVRKLTGGQAYHVETFDWHPSGARLVFAAAPTPDVSDGDLARLYQLELSSLAVTPLTEAGCSQPHWSPDGTQIAFIREGTPSYYTNNQLCLIPAGGGEIKRLAAEFDESLWLLGWGATGLYIGAAQRTSAHLLRVEPVSGQVTVCTPTEVDGWAGYGGSFDAGFSRAALIAGHRERLAEVVALELSDGAVRYLTNYNEQVADWQLQPHEVLTWTSRDGTEIEGVLTRPANFEPGQSYPLLVVIHGGPTGTSFPARLMGHERLYYPIQPWAAKGAFILQPNYRGSAGYGEAFRRLNVRNLGLGDYDDVISGVEALIERGWVDPERVGAMGWSQGGYISAFITTYSDRFKAVSVGAGISNWLTYYVNTDIHPFTRQYLKATPWDDPEVYARTSPMTYIKQAQTPTLIQHGEFDRRVPIPNAYELYQGLQDVGVETKLVVYKGMGHGISKPRLNRQVMTENLAWFNRWLWGETPAAAETTVCYIALAGGEQRPDAGELPAIERFTAAPVQDVYHWAQRDGVAFRLLSPQSGLLAADTPIAYHETDLTLAVAAQLAEQVAGQVQAAGFKQLTLYTPKAADQPAVLIGLGCLHLAAGSLGGVKVDHQTSTEPGW